jgi:hypothetical protein
MLHTLQSQFTAQCSPTHIILCYVHFTTTHITCWPFLRATCDWMLQTLQYQFAAQQSWLHNPSLHKRHNNTSYSLSFHGYAVTLLHHQGSLYFVYPCLALYSSSPSGAADFSTWSLIYTLCLRSISVYLLRLNFLGNEWASFDWSFMCSQLPSTPLT